MKKITLFLSMLVSPILMNAQITLNASNAPSVAQCQIQDTFNIVTTSSLPNLSPATNATWDMTSVMNINTTYHLNQSASYPAFPNATFNIPSYYSFAGSLAYNSNRLYNITSNGIIGYGEHIDRQASSLSALTAGANDSLVFTLQDNVFNPTNVYLKYPCTMGTNWISSYSSITNFNLTVAAYFLNNTPGQRRSVFTVTNSVVGWGKMKVKDLSGNPSGYMDVLQVKIKESVADSFFLNGSPAPALLLSAFNLTQGQVTNKYTYNFYRAGEFKELAYIEYTDSTYSTPSNAEIHEQRLASPTSVATLTKDQIRIYPNPVVNNTITVKLNGVKSANNNYTVINTIGQQVATGKLADNGIINLPASLSKGFYFLKIVTEDGAIGVKEISLMN